MKQQQLPKAANFTGTRLRQAATFRIALYCLVVLLAVVIGITETQAAEAPNIKARVADVIGLTAFGILALQFVLSSRLSWVERPFGLDRLFRFHRSMGITAGVLLVAHPLLMASSGEPGLLTKLILPWPVQAGRAAVLVLLATVLVSLRRTALRIPYERWQRGHNFAAITLLILAFAHSFLIRGGIHTWLGRVYWILLAGLALFGWGYRHIPALHRHQLGHYVVSRVIHEANDTWTLVLTAKAGDGIPPHLPGQFAFIRPLDGDVAAEEHPFTIASCAEQEELAFTIRNSGDFTAQIHKLKQGTNVRVRGPFGRFSANLHSDESELVFIAGGVGITPFLSMVRSMHRTAGWRRVTLLHACRTEADILMDEELSAIERSAAGQLRVVRVLSSPDKTWQGVRGHIDGETIRRQVSGISEQRGFYVCGPPKMMTSIEKDLKEMGISAERIHSEKFSL